MNASQKSEALRLAEWLMYRDMSGIKQYDEAKAVEASA